MPDGDMKPSLTPGTVARNGSLAEEVPALSAIERREARRQARTPMTDGQLERWIEFENQHFEEYGLAGEDHLSI